MTGIKKNADPAPIDLTVYEDYFLDLPEINPGRGFGSFIQVHSKENGKRVQKNLWDTANPQGVYGEDGFLSYEEAKGKIFEVPMAFCNSPGTMSFEVTNRRDFRELRTFLATPFRIHNFSVHSCQPKEEVAAEVPPLPNPDSMQDLLNKLRGDKGPPFPSMSGNEEDSLRPIEGFTTEQALEAFKTSASTFVSGLAQSTATYSLHASLDMIFKDAGLSSSTDECNWDLDEELPDHCFEEN